MVTDSKATEDAVFLRIELAMQVVADRIDTFESLDDFQLVDLYTEIDELDTQTSFQAFVEGMFDLTNNQYDPTLAELRAQRLRYESLTKHHPTNAYRRFHAIADDMGSKCHGVDAVLRDRQERAVASARAKLAKDPTQVARGVARALWPEANRKGWTAAQLHAEISARGHAIAFDTVRKWLTTLRKSGTC